MPNYIYESTSYAHLNREPQNNVSNMRRLRICASELERICLNMNESMTSFRYTSDEAKMVSSIVKITALKQHFSRLNKQPLLRAIEKSKRNESIRLD